jgi:hypothetical protein
MNVRELGRLLESKYGSNTFLNSKMPPKQIKASIIDGIDALWQLPNKTFNILRACADADASAPKDEHEKSAVAGFQFCQRAVQIVDYLKAHRNTMGLASIRKALNELIDLIQSNMGEGSSQFPHVSALIFQMMPYGKKHDRKIREQEYAKARKGLARMVSLAISIINEINKLGGVSEEEGRFDPQGAKLSDGEIVSFIRQYGDDYGIPDIETWSLVVNADPDIEKPLTTLIHALSRGHAPSHGGEVKRMVQDIVLRHQENNPPANTLALEQEDVPPTPIEFGDKIASKYQGAKNESC